MPADERAEYQRIYRQSLEAKLSTGTVHVYLVASDGRPIDSLHVAEACKPDRMLAMLEQAVATLNVKAGDPVIKPTPRPVPSAESPDGLILHLTARYLEKKGNDFVRMQPVLGTDRSSQWASLPSENWIVLTPAECSGLLPQEAVTAGLTWTWERKAADRLFVHFYPPTENTDVAKNGIDEGQIKATVTSVDNGVARARLAGRLRMRHSFYHKDTDEYVDAPLAGYLEFAVAKPRILKLRLTTSGATYGGPKHRHHFGVAVRSLP